MNENEEPVTVHPLTNNPTAAWASIAKQQKIIRINVKSPSKPVDPDKVRFVCMSDTHSLLNNLRFHVPDGDVFLHAGDFTKCGSAAEVQEFDQWLAALPHKHKIVIAGNHELSFDPIFASMFRKKLTQTSRHMGSNLDENVTGNCCTFMNVFKKTEGHKSSQETAEAIDEAICTSDVRKLLTNCLYLEDESVEVYGIKIYGAPWQPEFGNWAFNLPRGERCLEKWNKIPVDTDILLTHTPPLGHGDLACSGVRAGCVELLATVQQRVKPKYHVFGHIHEGYGVTSDGRIVFINASTCDINYIPSNIPIVFDVPLPKGQKKT